MKRMKWYCPFSPIGTALVRYFVQHVVQVVHHIDHFLDVGLLSGSTALYSLKLLHVCEPVRYAIRRRSSAKYRGLTEITRSGPGAFWVVRAANRRLADRISSLEIDDRMQNRTKEYYDRSRVVRASVV